MTSLDSHQLVEVERDAFPTLWPPTPFKRELNNKLAKFLTAVALEDVAELGEDRTEEPVPPNMLARISTILRKLLPVGPDAGEGDYLLGYIGLWQVVDDAHVVSIGVRTPFRRHGVGEALLIRGIETAMGWGSRYVTLEVRVSNRGAQSLYYKYGFKRAGVRKRYYLDNNEDAYIMTTDSILSAEYKETFAELKDLHAQRALMELRPATPLDAPAQ